MDKVVEVKVQFNKEKWFNLIRERQNSGLTIKEWCSQNNIQEHTYYYWLRRIRMSACTEYMGAAQNEPIIIHMQNKISDTVQLQNSFSINLPYFI